MVDRARPGAIARDVLDLRSIGWLEDLDTSSSQSLAEQLGAMDVTDGTLVQEESEPLDRVLLVRSGRLSVQQDGRERIATPEQPVVLLQALSQRDSGLRIRAQGRTRLFTLRTNALWEALEEDFNLLVHSLKQLASTIGTTHGAKAMRTDVHEDIGSTDLVSQLIWLRRTEALSNAPVRAVSALARRGRFDEARSGTTLWPMGAAATSTCFVLSGTLIEGRHICRAGAFVGEMEALAERSRSFPCVASEASRLLWLDVGTIWDVLEDHFSLCRHLLARLSNVVLDEVVPGTPARTE
jgi:CRP-like cAMP-binding protein